MMSQLFVLMLALQMMAVLSFHSPFLRFSSRSSSLQMKYNVKVINKKRGTDNMIVVPPTKIILDSAEEQALTTIPYSCRAGSCSSCLGKLKSGEVDQSGNIFLSDQHIDEGWVLTCVAYPMSDIEIEVDVEMEFYNMNPDLKIE